MKKCRDVLIKNMMLPAAKDDRNDDFACQTSLWMIANFHIILRYWCWYCGVAISIFLGGFFPCASSGICTVLIPFPTLTFKSMIFLFRRWDILGGYFKMETLTTLQLHLGSLPICSSRTTKTPCLSLRLVSNVDKPASFQDSPETNSKQPSKLVLRFYDPFLFGAFRQICRDTQLGQFEGG